MPKFMVVKQSSHYGAAQLQCESSLLRRLAGTGTRHIVRILKGFYQE